MENFIEEVDILGYFQHKNGHGNSLIIKGGVGNAKTTLLTGIVKECLEYSNFVVIGNVRFTNEVYLRYPGRLYYISKFSEYLDFYSKTPYDKPILLIVDDSQGEDTFKSTGVLSDGGKILASFMIYIRKLATSFIYIAHQKYIPESITGGFEPYFLYKSNLDDFAISQEFYIKDSDAYKDPKSTVCEMHPFEQFDKYYLPFLSHAFTTFEFDCDWWNLKSRLSAFEVGEDLKPVVANFLNDFRISQTEEFNKYDFLKQMTLTDYYLGLCLKKGEIIPPTFQIKDLIDYTMTTRVRKKIENENLLNNI